MVRDNRIKEYRFAQQSFNAATVSTLYTDHSINGEVLEVAWNQQGTAGSIALSESGTGFEFFRRNNGSGTAWQQAIPRQFTESTTGSIANASHVSFNANTPLVLSIGSMASGTTHTLDLVFKYR